MDTLKHMILNQILRQVSYPITLYHFDFFLDIDPGEIMSKKDTIFFIMMHIVKNTPNLDEIVRYLRSFTKKLVQIWSPKILSGYNGTLQCMITGAVSVFCTNMDQVIKICQPLQKPYVPDDIVYEKEKLNIILSNEYELALYFRSRSKYGIDMMKEFRHKLSNYPYILETLFQDLTNLAK